MSNKNPGITISENGKCNICNNEINRDALIKIQYSLKQFKIYKEKVSAVKGRERYDALLMLSGGKDSIYVLDKLVNEEKLKVISYTLDHPYESENAKSNIQKVIKKMDIEHISHMPNISEYKQTMIKAFENKVAINNPFEASKFPCLICDDYMVLNAYFMALKLYIPFVFYCLDPTQLYIVDTDIKFIMEKHKKLFSPDYTHIVKDIEREMSRRDSSELPIVVSYFAKNVSEYSREDIIAYLKSKGLYEKSPIEQVCSLRPLLDYYSFKKYDQSYSMFEFLRPKVLNGELGREAALEYLNEFRMLIVKMVEEAEMKNNLENSKEKFNELFSRVGLTLDQAEYLTEKYLDLIKYHEILNINPENI